MEPLEEKIKILSKKIEKPLDFICHCGDICHNGTVEDYQEVKEYFERYFPQVPFLVTVGNHDNFSPMEEVFSTEQYPISGFVRDFDDLQVISVDSCDGGSGTISEQQGQWVLQKMEKYPEKNSILFTHHHFLSQQSPMPCAEIDETAKKILQNPKNLAILTGHTHYHFVGEIFNTPYFTVDSLSFQGVDSGYGYLCMKESSGYNLFSYENGTISLEERGNLGFQKDIGIAFF